MDSKCRPNLRFSSLSRNPRTKLRAAPLAYPCQNRGFLHDAEFTTCHNSSLPLLRPRACPVDFKRHHYRKMIVQNRDMALMETGNIWPFAASERQKRTVYGELALSNFLQSLFESIAEEVASEAIENVALSHLENYAPELSTFQARLSADAMARVQLLEKGTCP